MTGKKNLSRNCTISFSQERLIGLILIIVVYVFIVGFRYKIGADWISYYEIYNRLEAFGIYYDTKDYDIGYYFLNLLSVNLGLGFYFVLSVVAMLTIYFVIKSVGKATFLLPFYLFFFYCGIFIESLNVMRQVLSCFACFYAANLLVQKRYKLTVVVLVVAWSFHRSSLIVLSYLPFLFFNPFKSRYVNLLLILSSFIFGEILYGSFKELMIGTTLLFPGSRASESVTDYGFQVFEANAVDWNAQIAKYFYLILNIMIVWVSPRLQKLYDKYHYSFFFSLFMVGQLLQPILIYHSMFQRLNYYFYLYYILIISYFSYTLWHKELYRIRLVGQRIVVVAICLTYLFLLNRHILSSDNLYPYRNYIFDFVLS